jgi:hypothetical protein
MPASKKLTHRRLRLEILDKMTQLSTSAFGLVASLAWNDAIQGFFKRFYSDQQGLVAKFIYATLITVLIVFITIQLGRLSNRFLHEDENE